MERIGNLKNCFVRFIIFSLIVSLSCTYPLYNKKIDEKNEDFNPISKNIESATQNIIIKIPQLDWLIEKYVVRAVNSNEDEPIIETTETNEVILVLKVGIWDITVDAVDANGMVLYQGCKNLEITTEDMEVNIILFKRAGNLKLTIENQSDCDVKKGEPGAIVKIAVTLSRNGYENVVKEISDFDSVLFFQKLNEGEYTVTVEAKGLDLNSDYSWIENQFTTYFSNEYQANVISGNTLDQTLVLEKQIKVTPVIFSQTSGIYLSPSELFLHCDTPGAQIVWTDNDWKDSYLYVSHEYPITINSDKIIKAKAVLDGMEDSIEGVNHYSFDTGEVSALVFSPPGGVYNKDLSISITSPDENAQIFYAIYENEEEFRQRPAIFYNKPVSISGNQKLIIIRAIAYLGSKSSLVATHRYQIFYPQTSLPGIVPESGLYSEDQFFTIETTTPGSTIYYTLDGSDPKDKLNPNRLSYIQPFQLSEGDYLIQFYAENEAYSDSDINAQEYKIRKNSTNTIVIDVADIIIPGIDWNKIHIKEGYNWLGIEIFEENDFYLEWMSDISKDIKLYQYEDMTQLELNQIEDLSAQVRLPVGKYLVGINSDQEIESFLIRLYSF